ncbi:MAG: M20/M25/M40 family metallo-hydrolase [Candidatus Hodarchaeales archaeon]|jgi:acetylornithine deacetylase/succinyl-diaminopimelate desuccinylase-like protein
MSHEKVINLIERDFTSTHLKKIQEFVKQPSVSATGEGIEETSKTLMKSIESLGGENVHLAEMMGDEFGHPQVYGEVWSDKKNKPTILFYSMYDVQPVYPEKWIIDDKKINPFGAEIHNYEWFPGYKGKCLLNRGITNQKGPTMSALNVLNTILDVEGELPVNLIFAIEGEEELGSPHLEPFINKYAKELKLADAVYFPMFLESHKGEIKFYLGVRGAFTAKLTVQGGSWGGPVNRNLHSSYSGLVQNPIFKIMDIFQSLKNDDTNEILVPGINDDPNIVGPSKEDLLVIDNLLKELDFDEWKQSLNVEYFRKKNGEEITGEKAIIEQLFKPGLSVNGIESGYYGKGSMTIIPFEAHASLDIRLPPFQKVSYVKECYKKFISEKFPMANFELGAGYDPAKMSPSHPLIQATKQVYEIYNKKPIFYPLLAGSAPFSMFQSILGLPFVYGGLGHAGRAHSPLEYAVIESENPQIGGIIDYEKFFASLIYEFSRTL